ncbi:MAG TPA: NAD-dependent epimerase/dehydratase family protein, partial [Pilimelia sp.]|nr:NAD-dependent epimerase/dehydratase family protein [Pilimelia sp.]
MASSAELVDQIRRTAGPGQHTLDPAVRRRLATLTRALVRARPDSVEEFDRYLAVRRRRLAVPAGPVADAVRDRTVLVTGGSGCIGTALLHQLAALRPAKLISLGVTPPVNQLPAVRYTHADVRAPARIQEVFDRYRPDLVFHLAAQRDPGLAERRAAETIGTNLLGTATIVAAAERTGSQRLVYASPGKAVRPFTTDTYAGSKRMGEWLLADATAQGRLICSGVR